MPLFWLKLPLNVFPLQLAYVKSDLLSIYIPTQKSCDRVLRQAVNYDNRHNKNSPSVDRLLPDFIERFVDRPLVSFQLLASNKRLPLHSGLNVPSFGFPICQDKHCKEISINYFNKIKNPTEAMS